MDLPTLIACLLDAFPLLNRLRDSIAAEAKITLDVAGYSDRQPSYSLRIELPHGARIERDTHNLLDNGHGESFKGETSIRDGRPCIPHGFRSVLDGVTVTVVEYREARVGDVAMVAK